MRQFPPRRIVCLTEETVETLYLLGEQDRIVGVSGYAVRPPRVRREKPRVSAFISADIPKILALEPDLVLAFSDLQADIVSDLVRAGVAIHVFNQRDVAGILAMIRTLGALVGAAERADQLATAYEERLASIASAPRPSRQTKSLFRGMGRSPDQRHRLGLRIDRDRRRRRHPAETAVSTGREGPDHFAGCRARGRARCDPGLLVRQESRAGQDQEAPGWSEIPAVRNNRIVEIKSPLILQPGPAALTDGLDAIVAALWPPSRLLILRSGIFATSRSTRGCADS